MGLKDSAQSFKFGVKRMNGLATVNDNIFYIISFGAAKKGRQMR